jgi:uncharacterized protein (TIGR02453 family)
MRFASLIPDARGFLADLSQNNTRDWFQANKSRYDDLLKDPSEALLTDISGRLDELTGSRPTTKLFRPHRDVRFSKDKTPYHTHLHMGWTTPGSPQSIGWFFGISPDYISVGAGLMAFDKDTVTIWRETIDTVEGRGLADDVSGLCTQGFRLAEPELKRVPAPFEKDHVRGTLLRRKSLTLWRDFEPQDIQDPTQAIMSTFVALQPLCQKLAQLA